MFARGEKNNQSRDSSDVCYKLFGANHTNHIFGVEGFECRKSISALISIFVTLYRGGFLFLELGCALMSLHGLNE